MNGTVDIHLVHSFFTVDWFTVHLVDSELLPHADKLICIQIVVYSMYGNVITLSGYTDV